MITGLPIRRRIRQRDPRSPTGCLVSPWHRGCPAVSHPFPGPVPGGRSPASPPRIPDGRWPPAIRDAGAGTGQGWNVSVLTFLLTSWPIIIRADSSRGPQLAAHEDQTESPVRVLAARAAADLIADNTAAKSARRGFARRNPRSARASFSQASTSASASTRARGRHEARQTPSQPASRSRSACRTPSQHTPGRPPARFRLLTASR